MLALICRRFFALWAFMHALLSRAYRSFSLAFLFWLQLISLIWMKPVGKLSLVSISYLSVSYWCIVKR